LAANAGNLGEIRENCDVLTLRTKDLRRCVDKIKGEVRRVEYKRLP
jgi:hypothetical protein